MVREQFIQLLNETIEESLEFSYLDFTITQTKTQKRGFKTIVKIEYSYSSEYFLEIKIPEERVNFKQNNYTDETILDFQIICENSPGEIELLESTTVQGTKGVIRHLHTWLDLLWSELMAIPINRDIEELKNNVDDIIIKMGNIEGDFTKEEKESILQKLEGLENKFVENLKSQELEKEDLESKISMLHKEINSLKKTLPILKKKNWIKSFSAKVLNWSAKPENRKMLSDGTKIIKGLINNEIE